MIGVSLNIISAVERIDAVVIFASIQFFSKIAQNRSTYPERGTSQPGFRTMGPMPMSFVEKDELDHKRAGAVD